MPAKVLIVCLGNICRSPMGEAVLKDIAAKRGVDLQVDSAGTAGYHVGDDPDSRTVSTCKKHQIPISHSGRKIAASDFATFDYILAADEANLRDLTRMKLRNATAKVSLWGSYLNNEPIPDPYYGGMADFEHCFNMCVDLSNAFLDKEFGEMAEA